MHPLLQHIMLCCVLFDLPATIMSACVRGGRGVHFFATVIELFHIHYINMLVSFYETTYIVHI